MAVGTGEGVGVGVAVGSGVGVGTGSASIVEDIAIASAFWVRTYAQFSPLISLTEMTVSTLPFFQRFELVALFVGQFAQVGLLAGLKPVVLGLPVFGGVFSESATAGDRANSAESANRHAAC